MQTDIKNLIAGALEQLFLLDAYLLQVQVNERSLTHRLAIYLEQAFPDFDVDCEYNRNGNLPKMLYSWSAKNVRSDDLEGVTVFPDITVHKRNGENYLIIEAKKSSNSNRNDISKLEAYKKELGYKYAAFVVFPVGSSSNKNPFSYVQMY